MSRAVIMSRAIKNRSQKRWIFYKSNGEYLYLELKMHKGVLNFLKGSLIDSYRNDG